jgi:hypothetical protein
MDENLRHGNIKVYGYITYSSPCKKSLRSPSSFYLHSLTSSVLQFEQLAILPPSVVMKLFSQLCVATLASYVNAVSVDVNKRATPLSVELKSSGNSEVKITVINNGDKAMNLLSKGTFLDEQIPVEKVTMYTAGGSKSNSHSPQPVLFVPKQLTVGRHQSTL